MVAGDPPLLCIMEAKALRNKGVKGVRSKRGSTNKQFSALQFLMGAGNMKHPSNSSLRERAS